MHGIDEGVYHVSIPYTRRDHFDYHSGGLTPSLGTRVWVPFHKDLRIGVVVGVSTLDNITRQLKPLSSVIDEMPLLSMPLLTLCRWISAYYQAPLSEVIPLTMPAFYRRGDVYQCPMTTHFYLTCSADVAHARCAPRALKQHALIDLLATASTPVLKKHLSNADITAQTLHALLTSGLVGTKKDLSWPIPLTITPSAPLPLHEEQASAVQAITQHTHAYRCFLLQGVTGSGKTEVYLQAIAAVLETGHQVMVLVPEIGLTPQLLSRFRDRFSVPMGVMHSELTDRERQAVWTLAREDKLKLLIGTRSAVLTPMPSLGLIVIDEEHDTSFKQMEGVRYSARDVALMRAHKTNIPIVLGSATPSLESLHNCTIGKYHRLRLQHKALVSTPLHYEIMDIRHQPLQEGLAHATIATVAAHLQQQNQVLVFINRRGFSPVLLCHDCGWMADCPACDAHLTLHRQTLICHHCGLTQARLSRCKACMSSELLPIGAGTQRIHEHLKTQFPRTSILRIDRDEVSQKHQLAACLEKIETGEAQLIIGTQMLAKGHHFPRLTLVVILDTDNGFHNQDFRSLEHLGQRLIQVAGRAGRAEYPGHVILQTHLPHHPLLNCLIQEGYEPFAEALQQQRQQAHLPPYAFMAVLRAESRHPENVRTFLLAIKDHTKGKNVDVLGPAPAPLARKAHQHRMQLLFKASTRQHLSDVLTTLRTWLNTCPQRRGVRWNIDVDPFDLS